MKKAPESGSRWQSRLGSWYTVRAVTNKHIVFTSERTGHEHTYTVSDFWATFDHERNAAKIKRTSSVSEHADLWAEAERSLVALVGARNEKNRLVQAELDAGKAFSDARNVAAEFRMDKEQSDYTSALYALDLAYGVKPDPRYTR